VQLGEKMKLTYEQKLEAINIYLSGLSCGEVANIFQVHRSSIRQLLKTNKIPIRTREQARKHKFNYGFFENIDNEIKSYWLGFIYAEGNIQKKTHTLSIELGQAGRDHLIRFAKDIGYNYHDDHNKKKNSYRIRLNSKQLVRDLDFLGVHPKKSYTIKMPSISNDLIKHFIRGFVDGDGSIKFRKIERRIEWSLQIASSSLSFLEGCKFWINKNTKNNFGSIQKGFNKKYKKYSYRLMYSGNGCSFAAARWLYSGNKISLLQKQKRFDLMLEYNKNRIPRKWGKGESLC